MTCDCIWSGNKYGTATASEYATIREIVHHRQKPSEAAQSVYIVIFPLFHFRVYIWDTITISSLNCYKTQLTHLRNSCLYHSTLFTERTPLRIILLRPAANNYHWPLMHACCLRIKQSKFMKNDSASYNYGKGKLICCQKVGYPSARNINTH
jgi:hypothetical protein